MGKRKHRRATLIDLDSVIQQMIDEYGEDVYRVLPEAVEKVTEEATDKLKAGQWPTYSGSWTNSDVITARVHRKKVIHNADHYRLTHFLEKGHVVKNGTGRINPGKKTRTGKFPHIKPVEEWAQKELPQEVEREINSL